MLTNRFYVGDITYHGEVVSKGQHEPIVDAALFDRVQRARSLRTDRPVRRGEPVTRAYLLRGIATCVTCGGPMWANTMSHGGRHRYYRCAARIRGHSCDAAKTSLRADAVEEYVAGMFASWVQPSEWRDLIAQDDRTGVDDERRRMAARMSRLHRALLDELVPYGQASQELRALESQLAALDGRAAGNIGRGDELSDVRALWPLMTPEERPHLRAARAQISRARYGRRRGCGDESPGRLRAPVPGRQQRRNRGSYNSYVATPIGFEPTVSTVTGWRVRPLHHGAA